MTSPDLDPRKAFGAAIARWLANNSWPQRIAEDWCKAAGNDVPGPWASQMSQVIHCRLDPRTVFFEALGKFNKAVHARDFSNVEHDERLWNKLRHIEREEIEKGRIVATQAFCLNNNVPCTATDFFSMFVGELEIPEAMRASRFTEADFIRVLYLCNQSIERISLETMMTKTEILSYLDERVFTTYGEFGELLKRLALELEKPSVEAIIRFVQSGEMDPTKGCPVLTALEELLRLKSSKPEVLGQVQTAKTEANELLLELVA